MTATQTSTPTATATGKIAVIREIPAVTTDLPPSFMCVVDGITIGTSKHKDYFEFHKRRGDIVRLNDLDIGKFIYVGADGNIAEQKKVDGAPLARGNVTKAVALSSNPKPAPIGFNNQSHTQAQENGRKGAIARLKNTVVPGNRPSIRVLDDAAKQRSIENGRKGAERAAELRAQAASGDIKPVKVPGKPGRPRKVNTEHAL